MQLKLTFATYLDKIVVAKHKMNFENTSGYMWFPLGIRRGQNVVSTKLCRGILRAWKDPLYTSDYFNRGDF